MKNCNIPVIENSIIEEESLLPQIKKRDHGKVWNDLIPLSLRMKEWSEYIELLDMHLP